MSTPSRSRMVFSYSTRLRRRSTTRLLGASALGAASWAGAGEAARAMAQPSRIFQARMRTSFGPGAGEPFEEWFGGGRRHCQLNESTAAATVVQGISRLRFLIAAAADSLYLRGSTRLFRALPVAAVERNTNGYRS